MRRGGLCESICESVLQLSDGIFRSHTGHNHGHDSTKECGNSVEAEDETGVVEAGLVQDAFLE